jgi:hypothetical protein
MAFSVITAFDGLQKEVTLSKRTSIYKSVTGPVLARSATQTPARWNVRSAVKKGSARGMVIPSRKAKGMNYYYPADHVQACCSTPQVEKRYDQLDL